MLASLARTAARPVASSHPWSASIVQSSGVLGARPAPGAPSRANAGWFAIRQFATSAGAPAAGSPHPFPLVFAQAAVNIPKTMAMEKAKTGEDAAFGHATAVGVADGVGGWASVGIDPSKMSRKVNEPCCGLRAVNGEVIAVSLLSHTCLLCFIVCAPRGLGVVQLMSECNRISLIRPTAGPGEVLREAYDGFPHSQVCSALISDLYHDTSHTLHPC